MDHYYIRTFDHMIAKMTRYANWGAAQMFIDGKTTNLFGIFGHPIAKFVRDFIFNLGFLDGIRGLISVGMHVYYTFWKYAKLWELTQLKRRGKPVPLPEARRRRGAVGVAVGEEAGREVFSRKARTHSFERSIVSADGRSSLEARPSPGASLRSAPPSPGGRGCIEDVTPLPWERGPKAG